MKCPICDTEHNFPACPVCEARYFASIGWQQLEPEERAYARRLAREGYIKFENKQIVPTVKPRTSH